MTEKSELIRFSYDNIAVEAPRDIPLDQLVEKFIMFLEVMGYSNEEIEDVFYSKEEWSFIPEFELELD